MPSLEDTIREKANCVLHSTHFMIVDGISDILNQKAKCPSSYFHAFGLKWFFRIRSDQHEGYLSFFLVMADEQSPCSDRGVKCSFRLSVLSHTGQDNFPMFSKDDCFKETSSRGWGEFISEKLLKEKYIVDDKAVFCAEITEVNSKSTNQPTKGSAERVKLMKVAKNNSKFTWKITRFSSFTCNKTHSSYEFTVEQRRWKLEMYPKGDKDGVGNLSLYLNASDYEANSRKAPTLAIYKLRVLDQLKLNHYEKKCGSRFSSDEPTWGISNFLSSKELHNTSRGFLVNNEIYLGVEFLFVATYETLSEH